jgi:hypothetical protein
MRHLDDAFHQVPMHPHEAATVNGIENPRANFFFDFE